MVSNKKCVILNKISFWNNRWQINAPTQLGTLTHCYAVHQQMELLD